MDNIVNIENCDWVVLGFTFNYKNLKFSFYFTKISTALPEGICMYVALNCDLK